MALTCTKAARGLAILALAALTVPLSGCQAGYFIFGKGEHKAAYKLPKKTRLLVLVDARPGATASLRMPRDLGHAIALTLYRHRVANDLVPQYRVTTLRRATPNFSSWSVAKVARHLNAPLVLYVYVSHFSATATSQHQVTQGQADARIEVINDQGQRLWPKRPPGYKRASISIPMGLASDQSVHEVRRAMVKVLAMRISQYFYKHPIANHPADN